MAVMELLDRIPIELDSEEVSRNIHLDEGMAERLGVEELVETVAPLIQPRALYTTDYVSDRVGDVLHIGSARFESRVLARNLGEVERVFPYVLTIGNELEDEASTHENILKQLFLERLAISRLDPPRRTWESTLQRRMGLERYRVWVLDS